ncbi:MAG: Extracellular ligand-binding receptor [Chloroflexi bacterium]|nr:Extracellular ligand-binding receptor [Chloroflexota bacterium]
METEALAPLIWEDGIRTLVTIGRDDIGNEGLQIAMKRNFEGKGGRVIDGPRYSATATDYGPSVQTLSARAKAAVEQNDPKAVGIYLTAFSEVVDLFHAAQSDPLLGSLRWYGSDGVAELPALVKDPRSAAFAAKVGYPNPNVGLDQSRRARWQPLSDQVKEITGSAPDAFGLAAYDAFRVATQAYLATGGTNQTAWLREAITQAANGYDGLSGEMVLNDAGDRKSGDFAFWAIREVNGILQWTIVAQYRADPSGGGSIVRAESFHEALARNEAATATLE